MMKASERHRARTNFLSGSPARFAATLVLALLATTPGFRDVFRDGGSLPVALMQFLVAFAVLWVSGGIVAAVLRRAPADIVNLEMPEMVPGAAGTDR